MQTRAPQTGRQATTAESTPPLRTLSVAPVRRRMAALLACVVAPALAALPTVAGGAPARADLGVTIDDRPDPVGQHQTLTYSVTTVNGATTVTGVTLSVQLPNDVTFKSVWTSGGTCNGTTTVVCTQGSLAAYESASATVNVQPTGPERSLRRPA